MKKRVSRDGEYVVGKSREQRAERGGRVSTMIIGPSGTITNKRVTGHSSAREQKGESECTHLHVA